VLVTVLLPVAPQESQLPAVAEPTANPRLLLPVLVTELGAVAEQLLQLEAVALPKATAVLPSPTLTALLLL
jgi:hypothetical protein